MKIEPNKIYFIEDSSYNLSNHRFVKILSMNPDDKTATVMECFSEATMQCSVEHMITIKQLIAKIKKNDRFVNILAGSVISSDINEISKLLAVSPSEISYYYTVKDELLCLLYTKKPNNTN